MLGVLAVLGASGCGGAAPLEVEDAGASGEDAGRVETDAGAPESDAGPISVDAGAAGEDAGGGAADAGVPAIDAGPLPPGYAADVQPLFAAHCAPCHTLLGSGGTNFASSYAASQAAAGNLSCVGLTVGACTAVRVANGSMPGSPPVSAAGRALLEAWVAGGQLP